MHAIAPRALLLAFAALAVSIAACGGTVVFEEQGGGDGGQGGAPPGGDAASSSRDAAQQATSGVTTSGGNGGADMTSTAIASTGASVTSASTGPAAPCLGLACGEDCVQCSEFECLNGFCDELGACVPERVCPPPRTETLCYLPSEDEVCADLANAPFLLCRDCASGKGCTFFGDVLDGPEVMREGCCYEVDGDCVPNP